MTQILRRKNGLYWLVVLALILAILGAKINGLAAQPVVGGWQKIADEIATAPTTNQTTAFNLFAQGVTRNSKVALV